MGAGGSSAMAPPQAKRSLLAWISATFFGVGFLRPGPGTWASAVTAAIWFVSVPYSSYPILVAFIAAALVTVIGVPVSSVVERESGVTDPGFVVIDEVAGQLIALIAIPVRWQYVLASFILFRGFDILKPPPLRKIEKLPGGWGIMLDDVGAGLYALALLQLWILFTHAH